MPPCRAKLFWSIPRGALLLMPRHIPGTRCRIPRGTTSGSMTQQGSEFRYGIHRPRQGVHLGLEDAVSLHQRAWHPDRLGGGFRPGTTPATDPGVMPCPSPSVLPACPGGPRFNPHPGLLPQPRRRMSGMPFHRPHGITFGLMTIRAHRSGYGTPQRRLDVERVEEYAR